MEITVNDRVKLLRNTLGLSQTDFAAKIGMSATGVWKLETGESKPRSSTLVSIAHTFGIERDWLINGIGKLEVPDRDKDQDKTEIISAVDGWKSKAEHLEKEVSFYRELLLNLTGKASANFLEAFGAVGLFDEKLPESVRAAA